MYETTAAHCNLYTYSHNLLQEDDLLDYIADTEDRSLLHSLLSYHFPHVDPG